MPLRDDTLRTLIWTPDASRAMALIGNTPDAYNQTWHLPCDDERLTYRELVELAAAARGDKARYRILKTWIFRLGGLFNKQLKEVQELLPRYKWNNIFSSEKFKKRFPEFKLTAYRDGIAAMAVKQSWK